MTENKKRFRIEFTVDAEGWSDESIKHNAIQELTCMVPYPEDITFSEVSNPWHTGTPSEEGWYLLHVRGTIPFRVAYMRNWQWLSTDDSRIRTDVVIEWQKIKENEDGQ